MNRQHWSRWWHLGIVACAAIVASSAGAHEFKLDALMNAFVRIQPDHAELVIRAPLYLFKPIHFPVKGPQIDISASAAATARAVDGLARSVTLYEDGRALEPSTSAGRLSLPSDKSFRDYDAAAAHVAEPIAADTEIYIDQGYVDARFTYAIRSPASVFRIRTTAAPELGDYLRLSVRYLPLAGDDSAMVLSSTAGAVALNPTWFDAAGGFIVLGIVHILTGYDHLLFLLCLIIPLRGWRQILAIVTTFTVAHSLTLLGSAFRLAPDGAWFPPFVETMIAASIVYMALDNIVGANVRRRVIVTGLFGLVHGFGFAYGLQENLQFAGRHLLVSLFAFNVGIEAGQVMVLAVMLPLLALVRRHVLPGRVGEIVLSAIVAHTAWHWMTERADVLSRYPWPRIDADTLVGLGAALVGIAIAASIWRAGRRWRAAHEPANALARAPGD
ncbi:MAG TPA: HupE/UreJ family protein [Casimicrobiaceae bacterium]|nr:HupE/UreJ family protein [Casimicrobiaceae bacterium]